MYKREYEFYLSLNVYERATGEKVKLSLEGKENSSASSAYDLCFMCFD
jgi:hypothetical protein